ncbi:MAG: cell division protein ZapA [Longimicrobiales bacterium]|jgi:cell division protein ZapA (FtsZ GTPase activity inhibitor)|nr:cell division protein ZapA [Longimicrobiales bacterium]
MSPKTSVTVRIAGEEHTIRASAEPEYTRRCATMVDDRIHEIRMAAGLIEGHKAAILAALSIADECFQARDDLEKLRADLARQVDALAEQVERSIPS